MKGDLFARRVWLVLGLTVLLAGCGAPHREMARYSSTVPSADGSEISYGVSGGGDVTVVFIHCWTCNHKFWNAQIEYFENKYRVAWLDLAGHGESRSNRRQYTMRAFGEDVAAVVNQMDADRVILVGHSMGGPVAVEAAELLGDRVIGMAGVDTFYTGFEFPESKAKIAGFVKPFEEDFKGASENMVRSMFTPQADSKIIEWVIGQLSEKNREMGISAMYEYFKWNAENVPASLERHADKLRNVNAAPTGNEKALHEGVTMIPGVGHFVPQVKPAEFNQVLARIIEDDLLK